MGSGATALGLVATVRIRSRSLAAEAARAVVPLARPRSTPSSRSGSRALQRLNPVLVPVGTRASESAERK